MESVISLPTNNHKKTELVEYFFTVDNRNFQDESNFKKSFVNQSLRKPKRFSLGSGSVRRSVRNFENKVNGKPKQENHQSQPKVKLDANYVNSNTQPKEINRDLINENSAKHSRLGAEEKGGEISDRDSEEPQNDIAESDTIGDATCKSGRHICSFCC